MPGSSMNLADANTVLNTAVAKELKGYADELERADDFEKALVALVKRTLHDHKRIIFNGNGYSDEWEVEAEKRGLFNLKTTVDAAPAMTSEKNIALFEEMGVLSRVEVMSRYEVIIEHYAKVLHIEAMTMLEMANKQLIPAATAYMSDVASAAAAKMAVSEKLSCKAENKVLEKLSAATDAMSDAVDALDAAVESAESETDSLEKAKAYRDKVLPAMADLRTNADAAEVVCGEDYWPLPSYSKMLYYV